MENARPRPRRRQVTLGVGEHRRRLREDEEVILAAVHVRGHVCSFGTHRPDRGLRMGQGDSLVLGSVHDEHRLATHRPREARRAHHARLHDGGEEDEAGVGVGGSSSRARHTTPAVGEPREDDMARIAV